MEHGKDSETSGRTSVDNAYPMTRTWVVMIGVLICVIGGHKVNATGCNLVGPAGALVVISVRVKLSGIH